MSSLSLGLATAAIGLLVVFFGLAVLICCILVMTSITDHKKKAPAPESAPVPAPVAVEEAPAEEDNGALIADLQQVATSLVAEHPEIGAFLLECSDLPPYAADIQAATGLPVFDFITLIDWAHQSVAQRPYYGWL